MKHQNFRILAFAIISLTLTITSCLDSTKQVEDVPIVGKPDNFDYGKVTNHVYKNSYFKCTMNLPKEWVVQDQAVMDEIQKNGREELSGGNDDFQEKIEASSINTATLLTISKFDMRAATESNPSIILIAENVNRDKSIDDGAKYLAQARKMLEQSAASIEYMSDNYKEEIINGTQFHRMDITMNVANQQVHQRYFATISKGFAFVIVATYLSEDQEVFMRDYITSIRFEKEK